MFTQNILSIDIGSATTKLVLGKQQGKGIKLVKTSIMPTPFHCYNDGNLAEIPKLAGKIRENLYINKLKAKKVIFTVNSTSVIIRDISVPAVKPEEMSEMIKYDIEQFMPISIDEYDIEYKSLEEYTEDGGKKTKVLVAAVQKTMVEGYINLAKELGLTTVAIDINPNSASKLFETSIIINNENYSADSTIALIDIGHSSITINFVANGKLRFSRVIPRGGRELEALKANEEAAAASEFQGIKAEKIDLASDSGLNNISRVVTDSWLQEIQRIIQYYGSRSNKNVVERVFLYGGSSKIKGIEEYYKSYLGLPVFEIKAMSNIKTVGNAAPENIKSCLNAIGAIIRR